MKTNRNLRMKKCKQNLKNLIKLRLFKKSKRNRLKKEDKKQSNSEIKRRITSIMLLLTHQMFIIKIMIRKEKIKLF